MRILALETSGYGGSVAAVQDRVTRSQHDLPTGRRTAQSLVPTIGTVLTDCGWRPADVELIAVTRGPGSFTGLRIGVTTAKTLAYATGASVLGVSTLEVLAEQSQILHGRVWSVLNAERGQLFAACYEPRHATWIELAPARILDLEQWLMQLGSGDYVTGLPLAQLLPRLPNGVQLVEQNHWQPSAAAVAAVAQRRFEQGERQDLFALLPDYLRESAAVEVAASKTL